MTLDRELIEITLLLLQEVSSVASTREWSGHREDVFRSHHIAAGLERRLFTCFGEASLKPFKLLLSPGALDHSELSRATSRLEPKKEHQDCMQHIGCTEHMTPRPHDAIKKRSIRCTACTAWNTELERQHDAEKKNNKLFFYIVVPCCKGVPVGKRVLNS